MTKRKIHLVSFCILGAILLQIYGCRKEDNQDFVTDIDGNEYGTVTIGTQDWMKANLRATKYNDGIEIPNIIDNAEWGSLTSGAYCWYDNDISYKTPYGAFYNWYAVNTGKLCPSGWRVASDQDWFELILELGGSQVAGGKIKTPGDWAEPNVGATNVTGFTAVPAGMRSGSNDYLPLVGVFSAMEHSGFWWSSTEFSDLEAFCSTTDYSSSALYSFKREKEYGFSVRCIKNK